MPRTPNTPRKSKSKAKTADDVQESPQEQLPGTEHNCSKELKATHRKFALAKYRAKAEAEMMKELTPEILELMRNEGVDSISVEIDVGGERRRCVTMLEENFSLSSKLDPLDEAA